MRCRRHFFKDEGWYKAAGRYEDFMRRHQRDKILYLELGVVYNTPVIIKYPFWKRTMENPQAVYACINAGQAAAPREIERRSICINGDIGAVLENLREQENCCA